MLRALVSQEEEHFGTMARQEQEAFWLWITTSPWGNAAQIIFLDGDRLCFCWKEKHFAKTSRPELPEAYNYHLRVELYRGDHEKPTRGTIPTP